MGPDGFFSGSYSMAWSGSVQFGSSCTPSTVIENGVVRGAIANDFFKPLSSDRPWLQFDPASSTVPTEAHGVICFLGDDGNYYLSLLPANRLAPTSLDGSIQVPLVSGQSTTILYPTGFAFWSITITPTRVR